MASVHHSLLSGVLQVSVPFRSKECCPRLCSDITALPAVHSGVIRNPRPLSCSWICPQLWLLRDPTLWLLTQPAPSSPGPPRGVPHITTDKIKIAATYIAQNTTLFGFPKGRRLLLQRIKSKVKEGVIRKLGQGVWTPPLGCRAAEPSPRWLSQQGNWAEDASGSV